jgi:hypothetical protein
MPKAKTNTRGRPQKCEAALENLEYQATVFTLNLGYLADLNYCSATALR